MPTVLPSIIISFHLSGSSLSLDVALSSLPASLSPDIYTRPRDLPSSSFLFPLLPLRRFPALPVHSLRRCLRWSGRVHATSVQVLLI